jgi:hypothetical protein
MLTTLLRHRPSRRSGGEQYSRASPRCRRLSGYQNSCQESPGVAGCSDNQPVCAHCKHLSSCCHRSGLHILFRARAHAHLHTCTHACTHAQTHACTHAHIHNRIGALHITVIEAKGVPKTDDVSTLASKKKECTIIRKGLCRRFL